MTLRRTRATAARRAGPASARGPAAAQRVVLFLASHRRVSALFAQRLTGGLSPPMLLRPATRSAAKSAQAVSDEVSLTSFARIRYSEQVKTSRTNWIRYCVPRDKSVCYDPHGFPHDPRGGFQPHAISLTAALRAPCVVLIGEPGMGKSDTVRQLSSRPAVPAGGRIFVDLCSGAGAETFSAEQFRRWREGHPLELYIDSLEDDPLFWVRLRDMLQDEQSRSNLRLRIACRTGALPELLNRDLPTLWGKNAQVHELMPLCRRDIELAAGADADEFMKAIVQQELAPLVVRPVYLQFFLQQFREHRVLPPTRWKLYEEGCRLLCKESNLVRKSYRPRDAPDSHHRLAVASRIAAVCILSDRRLIQRTSDCDERDEDTVLWTDLYDGDDATGFAPTIDEQGVRDALHGTSLFSARGEERLGFAHSSYASFLAARYMKSRAYRLEDLSAACAGPDFDGPIPLAIRDLAGWLASEDVETRRWLLTHDARVLLTGDLRDICDDERAQIVARLLELASHTTLHMHDLRVHYRKLRHPGLADQLRQWLGEKGQDFFWARCLAVELAGACGCKDLDPLLIEIALAREELPGVRADAFDELLRRDEPAIYRALMPLLLDPILQTPHAWARGWLVRSLWPDHLSDDELLQILDAMHIRRGGSAELDWFIERTLVPKASVALVLKLFDRMRMNESALAHGVIGLLGDLLVARALKALDEPGMLDALARFAAVCLARHTNPFWPHSGRGRRRRSRIATLATPERRRLARAIVEHAPFGLKPVWPRLYRLVDPRDTAWMIERYLEANDRTAKLLWLQMIADMVFEHPPAADSDAGARLHAAGERSVEFKAALWCWFGPIKFGWDSKLAGELSTRYEDQRRRRRERLKDERQRRAALKEVRTRLPRLVARIRAARPEPELLGELLHRLQYFEENARSYPDDVLDMKAWEVIPSESKVRFQEMAADFLVRHPLVEPETWTWDTHYRLLRFMQGIDPTWAPRQPASLWVGWVPAIVHDVSNDDPVRTALLLEAYRKLPDMVRWCLAVRVDRATSARELLLVRRSVQAVLAAGTAAFMALKLDDDYPAEPYGELLRFLLVEKVPGIEDQLRRLLEVDLSQPRARERARVAARILWDHSTDFSWPALAPRFTADPKFGAEVMGSVAQGLWSLQAETWNKKHEEAVAQVLAWMIQQFPEEQDPKLTDRMGDTERYKIGQLRHTFVVNLQSRGTPGALAAILRLQSQFPGKLSLPYAAGFARDHVAEAQWRPLSARQAIHLRRRRTNEPLLMAILVARTIPEMERVAKAMDQKFADDLPLRSSREDVAYRLIEGIRRRFSALNEASEFIRTVIPELAEELAHIGESREEQAHWTSLEGV